MGCTLIKVTTHSSSKSLDFLYKYFMLKLPEFFGYEIKFQTIEDVARRGCHTSTLKMLLRFATVICCGGVIVGTPWGVVLRHETMNIGNGPLQNFWEGGKVQKNFCAREN